MQGNGSYNANSALQWAAMMMTLSLFDGVYVIVEQVRLSLTSPDEYALTGPTITIVEYGSSQGANPIILMRRIFEQATNMSPSKPTDAASLVFFDLPSNDFTALTQTIDITHGLRQPRKQKYSHRWSHGASLSLFSLGACSLAALHYLYRVSVKSVPEVDLFAVSVGCGCGTDAGFKEV
ncbi:hypothetical protein AJ79_07498 [Helicocarpus griseus UAMH5409]|uniref:Uncharacterized protein n=1 Tax=Helicocarpus griseus UAMH5409 TaxID=1447875 RepID=A0A2B7X2E8_9EURO|nr:hypothetical protein AJ79_07498 [Helicocarpus griseus UAMH5409]